MVDFAEENAMALDPHQLLRALGTLLDDQGGAKGVPEILRIASLMKDAKKLVARCVYANILKNTKDEEIMNKFIQSGGWETLNVWLQDAKAISNSAFILELLDVYANVPVTVDLLKQNNCAKTIKQLSKSEEEMLVKPCSDLVDRWMAAIKAQPGSASSKSSDGSSKKHKHSSSDKSKHKSSDKSSSQNSGKSEKSHQHHHKSSSHHNSHSDKSKQKSSSDKSRSISDSSKSKESSASSNKSSDSAKRLSVDSRRESDSSVSSVTSSKVGEKRTSGNAFSSILSSADRNSDTTKSTNKSAKDSVKAKTAKTAPTKFRSTGLEQEVVLPPSKKKKSVENKLPVKRPSPLTKPKEDQPPEKRPKASSPSGKDKIASLATTTEETHGKIKIIPPKPKPVEMFESSGFMDAIGASFVPQKPKVVKRKKPSVSNVNTGKASGGSGNTSPPAMSPPHSNGSPTSPPKSMPSFYKDTLASPTAEKPGDAKSSDSQETAEGEQKEDAKSQDDAASVSGSEVSNSSATVSKKKKSVSWVPEKDLRSYFYFELDETERVNVNKLKNFEENKKQEMMQEKERMENARREHMQEMNPGHIAWRAPIRLSGVPEPLAAPGVNSTEREAQKLREESVLQALFFNKLAIPPSPAEADPKDVPYEEPKIMPLDDESGESVIDYTQQIENNQPEATSAAPSQFSLSPEVATLLQSLANQADQSKATGNHVINGSSSQAAALMPSAEELANLPPEMQNMLQSFIGNKDSGSNDDLINKLKNVLEPFNNSQANNRAPAYGQFPPPGGQAGLLTTPPVYGANMMHHPPPPHLPPPPMHHPGSRGPPMGYPPGGPGMYGGRPPLLGHAPMRGGPPPPHMRSGNPRQQRGPRGRQLCRHFQAGKCDRDQMCGFLHPGVNGPPL